MTDSIANQIQHLKQAIDALENQRSVLGDDVVANAVAVFQQQLSALQAQKITRSDEKERRLLTILSSDMVGSTQYAEKMDPEEWQELVASLLNGQSEIIAQNGGTVIQYLGDGLLALFGLLNMSESAPENAIRAALEIQSGDHARAAWGDLPLRIGIHTGMVFTSQVGSEVHRKFTATGDAMNLAQRIQATAPPRGVMISQDTFMQVRGMFDIIAQPAFSLQEKSEPVHTYLVRSLKQRSFYNVYRGVAGIENQTVGREIEFRQLQDAYDCACRQGEVVWTQLIGEPGVGKSRLMADFYHWSELQPFSARVFRSRAFEREHFQPFAFIRQMWFDLFQISEDTPPGDIESKWVASFRKILDIQEPEPAHILGLLVGLSFVSSPYIGQLRYNPIQLQGRAFSISRDIFRRIRAQNIVLVLLEDLHWADASSLEYIQAVFFDDWAAAPTKVSHNFVPGIQNVPRPVEQDSEKRQGMFILATTRPGAKLPEKLANAPASSSPMPVRSLIIQLARLPDDKMRDLARQLFAAFVDATKP